MEIIGKRGFRFHAFGADRDGPETLAGVRDFGGCADVVILLDKAHAYAYRTSTSSGLDIFNPSQVYWSYAASPVWTLRAVLTLAPPVVPVLGGAGGTVAPPGQARTPGAIPVHRGHASHWPPSAC